MRAKLKPGSPARVSTSKGGCSALDPGHLRLPPTGFSDATKVGEPAYPPWPHFVRPPEGLAGGRAPSDPRNGNDAP